MLSAPELPFELEWLNVAAPITLAELRGKMVLLDFWTYCCINCLHILPDLRYLETRFDQELVVLGIHSPKFTNEQLGTQVAQAITRYDIHHPVANDPGFSVWQQYSVRAWPTLVLIDTEGYIVGRFAGEGHRAELEGLIEQCLIKAKQRNSYRPSLLPAPLPTKPQASLLAFPGKVYATDDYLYISDSGHHRVLMVDANGKLQRIFGNGMGGFSDGTGEAAAFNNPQGLVHRGDSLLVADTNNHAIRKIDLVTGQVSTLAGTGEQATFGNFPQGKPLHCPLNSPWDVAVTEQRLYIAMAGAHQIWFLDFATQQISILAGSGLEHIYDGGPAHAAFAQPSGLALAKGQLFIADAETSAIRCLDLATAYTQTLIGKGLFEFGDQDGNAHQARLQHPLGITYDNINHCLWIADSYNHKIKNLDLMTQEVHSVTLPASLVEPGGLHYHNNTLWIADTNQHRILSVSLDSPVLLSKEFIVTA